MERKQVNPRLTDQPLPVSMIILSISVILLGLLCSACADVQKVDEVRNSSFLPQINLPEGPIINQGDCQPTPTAAPPASYNITSKLDSKNILQEEIILQSSDGFATLIIPKGTKIEFPDRQDQKEIRIACSQPKELLKEKRLLWGQIYTFSPENLRLDTPASLRIRYDPPFLDADKNEKDALIGRYEPSQSTWEWLDGELDLHKFAVTVLIHSFGEFSISLGLLYEAPMSFLPNISIQ